MNGVVSPITHLKGTAIKDLLRLRSEVIATLEFASRELAAMAPNERDFYSDEANLFERACRQHDQRMGALKRLIGELYQEIDLIKEAEAARRYC